MKKYSALFFGRSNCPLSLQALKKLSINYEVTPIFIGGRGENPGSIVEDWNGDFIFCFRSLYILTKCDIARAKIAAINFHPGPIEYPGSGCINFALYEGATEYGVTAHLINPKVDDGPILECRKFSINDSDDLSSLLSKTHKELLTLFFDVTIQISLRGEVFISEALKRSEGLEWSKIKRRIKDLEILSIINPNVSEDELVRLLRATYVKGYPPKIELHGRKFVYVPDSN